MIGLCLLISPLWADLWDAVANGVLHHHVAHLGGASYAFPGGRIALWAAG